MYANLLAKSMYETTRNSIHPSYVEIIKQLCPDEAKILKIFTKHLPVISVRFEDNTGAGVDVYRNFSDIGYEAKCEFPENVSYYLCNLERFGLLSTTPQNVLITESLYEQLKNHQFIQRIQKDFAVVIENSKPIFSDEDKSFTIKKGVYDVTYFGYDFKKICIEEIDD